MMNVRTTHPEPETLAAFADGRLDAPGREALVEHLDVCADCMHEASLAMTAAREEAPRRPAARTFWLLAAAAAIVLVLLVPITRNAWRTSPIDSLVAAAPRSARVVEPRLSGGFAWAEYGGPDRAAGDALDTERLKLGGTAGEVVERAKGDGSAEAQHAAGVAMVLIDKPLEAIAKLEAVTGRDGDARAWNDLAAARYAAAVGLGRTSLLPTALAAADASLRKDPNLAEALFNRALIVEKMGLTAEARKAWERYLAADGTSAWAREAREHLARLPVATRSSLFKRDQALLERAGADGDTARVRELVARYPQQARTFAEAEYLARWAEGADGERWLRIARNIGAALVATTGESLLHDAVASIDAAPKPARATLAAAHLAYRRGRIAHSRHDATTAMRELRAAASSFAAAGSPMALMARYYAASARLASNDTAGARRELELARTEADAHPRFIAYGAQVRWELARTHMFDDDWAGAASVLEQGAAMFRRLGERANESFVEAMLADALVPLGRFDEAWNARVRTFTALSAEGHSDMLASSIAGALQEELEAGRHDAALALTAIELDEVRPALAIDLLIHRAMLEAVTGGHAAMTVARAESLARTIPDAASRDRALADVAVSRGAAERDSALAAAALTRAIDFYRAHGVLEAMPEPLLLRARASVRSGDPASALRDLEEGMTALGRHREQPMSSGVLQVERALFTDAMTIALDRGDHAAAFAYAERSRGGTATLAAIQQRLAGSGTVVVEIVALPPDVVTFAISERDLAVAKRASALPLYERLIAPVEHVLAGAHRVIVVPDRSLEQVSFAALYDERRKQYLIERFEVAIASSASSLQPRTGEWMRTALATALPSGDEALLPETEGELADVSAAYASVERGVATLARLRGMRADVLHIAGHTARLRGAGEQALLFADGRASWKAIAALAPLHARVVVLAACETMRRPEAAETRALSLAAAFAGAGARDVIGTLEPIADRHARVLFGSFHRHLAGGASPAAALRAAQLEGIASGAEAWKSVALLTSTL